MYLKHRSRELTLKCLLNIDSFLGTGLKVGNIPFRLAERHSSFRGDHPLVLLDIDLITNYNLGPVSNLHPDEHKVQETKITYKWEIFWIPRACLYEKLVPPAVKSLKAL